MKNFKVCILAKTNKARTKEIITFTKSLTDYVDVFIGEINDPFPKEITTKKYDLLISYISPWIVPANILNKTKKWNINFHPGPPEYPGIGCFNFAIYNSEKEFGSTAHIMEKRVDTGEIIGVERFGMSDNETVESLSLKTYDSLFNLYVSTLSYINDKKKLPVSKELWKRKPYKREELEKIAELDFTMEKDELIKRIRSTYYPGKPAPFIDLHGHRFEYNPKR